MFVQMDRFMYGCLVFWWKRFQSYRQPTAESIHDLILIVMTVKIGLGQHLCNPCTQGLDGTTYWNSRSSSFCASLCLSNIPGLSLVLGSSIDSLFVSLNSLCVPYSLCWIFQWLGDLVFNFTKDEFPRGQVIRCLPPSQGTHCWVGDNSRKSFS